MDVELRKTVNHIKTEYNRPSGGKGFTDRTGNLRNSINSKTESKGKEVVGYTYAGEDYAPHVEQRYEGRYAFLWPGTNDRGARIARGEAISELLSKCTS